MAAARGNKPQRCNYNLANVVGFVSHETRPNGKEFMTPPRDLAKEAAEKRDMASRARRLARGLTWSYDRDRLNAAAQELEQEANALEGASPSAGGAPQ